MEIERLEEMHLCSADEAAIADLLRRCFSTDFAGRSYFMQRHHLRIVARDGGRITGHIGLCYRSVRQGDALIPVMGVADVATDPARRGEGIASGLLREAIVVARGSGATFMLLFGDAGLYAAHGFLAAENPLRYVELDDAMTGECRDGDSDGLMVLPLRDEAWDERIATDLLGHKF